MDIYIKDCEGNVVLAKCKDLYKLLLRKVAYSYHSTVGLFCLC